MSTIAGRSASVAVRMRSSTAPLSCRRAGFGGAGQRPKSSEFFHTEGRCGRTEISQESPAIVLQAVRCPGRDEDAIPGANADRLTSEGHESVSMYAAHRPGSPAGAAGEP